MSKNGISKIKDIAKMNVDTIPELAKERVKHIPDVVKAIKDITNKNGEELTADNNSVHETSQSNINMHKTVLENSFESLRIEQSKPKEEQDELLKEFLKQRIVDETDKVDIQTDKANDQTERISNSRNIIQSISLITVGGIAGVTIKTAMKKGGPALFKAAKQIKRLM